MNPTRIWSIPTYAFFSIRKRDSVGEGVLASFSQPWNIWLNVSNEFKQSMMSLGKHNLISTKFWMFRGHRHRRQAVICPAKCTRAGCFMRRSRRDSSPETLTFWQCGHWSASPFVFLLIPVLCTTWTAAVWTTSSAMPKAVVSSIAAQVWLWLPLLRAAATPRIMGSTVYYGSAYGVVERQSRTVHVPSMTFSRTRPYRRTQYCVAVNHNIPRPLVL
ncbi:uncharacterized protein EI97DRAFT_206851 [Westerdykella ornata]|uniref:Uncharacterized protein n=1 Tax=Westerdykella ornata TaxID=318751 RepID=A0A6A6J8S7_WESOR|nr:uncharacterized protein EI97DRAFT_206851 [Westerdykella ornata]KAF2272604.1 hypothetical protein EI97DRAFT_206851 [Westerdykella ornata]